MPLSDKEELELLELEKEQSLLNEKPGYGESALRGAGQGISFGYEPQLRAAIQSPFSDKTYEGIRDEEIAKNEAAKKENPGTFMAGEVGSGLAMAALPFGAALKGAQAAKAAKAVASTGGLFEAAAPAAGAGKTLAMKLIKKYGPGVLAATGLNTAHKVVRGLSD